MEVEVGTDCLAGKEKQLSIIIDNLFYHLRFFFFASHVVAFSIYESVNPQVITARQIVAYISMYMDARHHYALVLCSSTAAALPPF